MQGQLALLIRTFVLYPFAGAAAAFVSFLSWNADTGQLIVDVNAASVAAAGALWVLISSGTFAWSRVVKAKGGAT